MKNRSILIVERDEAERKILFDKLEGAGFNVLSASNGMHALILMRMTAVDVVVSDLKTPVISGVDLLKAVRNQGNSIPFIAMPGLDSREELVEILDLAFLIKVQS